MSENPIFTYQVETLIAKVKHYLITGEGVSADEATDRQVYLALSRALREEMMINWTATQRTLTNLDKRTIYYLSMEYLPGRFLGNNTTNISSMPLVVAVLHAMRKNPHDIFTCESDPGLGNGGLGRLASCFLDSLASLHYPAMGYGLRYHYGIFEQQFWDGIQVEKPDTWLLHENAWEYRRDTSAYSVKFAGESILKINPHGEPSYELKNFEEVRALGYDVPIIGYSEKDDFSVVTLRLWSTKESPRNFELQRYNAGQIDQAAENILLTDVLYPNDHHDTGKRIRLKQEFLLVAASLQDIMGRYLSKHGSLSQFADKVRLQINDTHPALTVAELMRMLTSEHLLSWDMAWSITQQVISYTNHTVLVEALEQWDQGLLRWLLPRQYEIIERLNAQLLTAVRVKYPNDIPRIQRMSILEQGRVRMANLAIFGSHHVNGVAALHSRIIKETIFKDFYELFPERFVNVTNGVTPRRWLMHCNPQLADFITRRIGKEWICNFSKIKELSRFAEDEQSQQEFWDIKRANKQRLIAFIEKNHCQRNAQGDTVPFPVTINAQSLFDVQIKRIHEYKRQLLNILHAIMIYQQLLENPNSRSISRTIFIGGKAAAGYEAAKGILRLISAVAKKVNTDARIQGKLKIILLENYNVSKAEIVIPAAELSQQISTAGQEASGTGNMKFSINGALTIGTDDGANVEMREEVGDAWWPFNFGASCDDVRRLQEPGRYDPRTIAREHPNIEKAVNTLQNNTFATSEGEHNAFCSLYNRLMQSAYGGTPDRYFVLYDLVSYAQAQLKVETLYQDSSAWAKFAISNIAGMGKFSTDRSIIDYANTIWNIDPYKLDRKILESVRAAYSEHDRCRIM